jgi:multidrug efflux pump subunit AcrB
MTRFAIDNSRTTLIGVACVILAGLQAFFSLPQSEDPGFIVRTAQVLTFFPGASPERVEMLVTEPLERAIKQMPELDFVRSTSKTGLSIINVDIQQRYKDIQPIWDDLRRKIESASDELPEGASQPNVDDDFGDVFGIVLSITGEGFSYAELEEVAKDVRDELLLLDMAGKVELHGVQKEEIYIEYSGTRLAESGLTPFDLQQLLASRNIITPGGAVETDRERITLEPSGNYESLQDLRRSVIPLPDGNVIFLEDIADVRRDYVDPPASRVYASGLPAIAVAISLKEGGNITELGADVNRLMREFLSRFPIGIEFDLVAYQPAQVERKVDDFVSSLLQSIGIVLVVMLISLGLRTGFVVAALIPTTMLASLMLMSFFDIGIDQISLASLIIALGMLVDNAIVMSESIMVSMESGKSARDAAIESATELRVPLLVASLTTSAAFLPIFLAKSTVGEYTASIFKVVTIALLSSWVLALTMTPLLCVLFLRVKAASNEDGFNGLFYRVYRAILRAMLRYRWISVAATAVVFFGVMSLFGRIPFQFFPPADRPLIRVEMKMPIGTTFSRSEDISRTLDRVLEELRSEPGPGSHITNWTTFVGSGAPRYNLGYAPEPRAPEYAYSLINLDAFEPVFDVMPRIETALSSEFPDLSPTVDLLKYGPPVRNPLEVRLSGKSLEGLYPIVDEVKKKMQSLTGVKNVQDDWGPRNKKLVVDVNQPRARRAGTSNQEIAVSLLTGLSGLELTQYREEDKLIPVTLRSNQAERTDVGKLETVSVYSQSNQVMRVPLKQVADLDLVWQPGQIKRRNQLKTFTVSAELTGDVTARDVNTDLKPWLDEQQATVWPPGTSYAIGGEEEESKKANASIMEQLPVAGLIILLLLVGQFNSVRRALIISLTIPLGLIGVTLGLLGTGSYFGFMTFLGIISLAGIVINNAIVLLDRINIEQAAGAGPLDAVMQAAQQRLRPILLTTATTVGGLLPLWFGGGAMFEPMAIAIIFGMIFSTLLTLGVVPVLYSLLFRVPRPA